MSGRDVRREEWRLIPAPCVIIPSSCGRGSWTRCLMARGRRSSLVGYGARGSAEREEGWNLNIIF